MAYIPDAAVGQDKYGFAIEDNGAAPTSSDMVTWVKRGTSLVGRDSRDLRNPEAPHRIEFFVGEDEEGRPAAAVRAWRLLGQPEEFEPEDVAPRFIARGIAGFNCRMQDPEADMEDSEIEWIDEWEDTNRLPYSVEVTLWMNPVEEGDEPVELKRIVQIPLAPLSWGRTASGLPAQSGSSAPDASRTEPGSGGSSPGGTGGPGAGSPGRGGSPPGGRGRRGTPSTPGGTP